ncbi:hypothetical protein GE09DRAFT_1030357 [Coniochaeta sp. 2T2.1]|nr:hypothetical protein GE09DRAFT_1030357 [Coniochaeta sp. 2T2.1]
MRFLSLVALGGAAALQLPFVENREPQTAPGIDSKPKLPLVDTEALQDLIEVDNFLPRAVELYEIAKLSEDEYNHPTRFIGSAGHLGTLDYITAELAKLGDYYTVSNQSFSATVGKVWEKRLVLGNDVPESATAMDLTPATKDKEPVSGDLVLVANNGCDPGDYPKAVKGNIAFISRGTCAFGAKSELAGKAGAVAAVVYNSEAGPIQGSLGDPLPDHVATFGLSLEDAQPVLEKLRSGETVEATAYINADVLNVTTTNIIAQTTGGDQDNCMMIGGHSDSVLEGPGINDDGSGTLTVLEVAVQLTKFSVNNCVRFAWWSAEEEGLLGSNYYRNTRKTRFASRLLRRLPRQVSGAVSGGEAEGSHVQDHAEGSPLANSGRRWEAVE